MSPTLTCLALAFVGVDFGYRPASDGGLELIVQIPPSTFRTLQPGDPITVAVTPEARRFRPSQVTVAVSDLPPPHDLPPPPASRPFDNGAGPAASRGAAAAPATAPDVRAVPLPRSPVNQAIAEEPAASSLGGPALMSPGAQGPVTVKPPSGPPAQPTTTDEHVQGTADSRAATALPGSGPPNITKLPQVDTAKESGGSFDGGRLGLLLVIIALAASNGYVGWLFWDARRRYLGLLARTFASA